MTGRRWPRVISYMPVVVVFGSDWESDVFGQDRANLEAAIPDLWSIAPLASVSKVRDEALRIFGDDTFRRYYWEESQKLRGLREDGVPLAVKVVLT